MNDAELSKAINDSGFPMQLGLKYLVESGGTPWRVALSEHPWRDPASGDDKFLDFVLRSGKEVMVVECKRSRDTDWIFLREPTGQAPNNERRIARSWVNVVKPNRSVRVNEWCETLIDPRSPVAQYCVIRKNNQRTQELLEKTAAEVVRAVEALATQDLDVSLANNSRLSSLYIPVIVTTARLYVCDVAPKTFDPADGAIPDNDFARIGMVRFEKSLNHPTNYGDASSLEEVAKQAERSVLIVESGYFLEFLRRWHIEVSDTQLGNEIWGQ